MKMKEANNFKPIDKRFSLIIIIFGFFILLSFLLNIITVFPKIIILSILIVFAFLTRTQKDFFKDWLIFLAVIYFFDTMRGLIFYGIGRLNLPVYCEYVFKIEKDLFGGIPSLFLQQTLLKNSNISWLEKGLTIIYGTHFLAFLLVGFYFWLKDKYFFKLFKMSFYLLLLIGIGSYALVPTAPPWMAADLFGLFPKLFHFNLHVFTMFIPDLTSDFAVNPVAAMPSLHAAFPLLCAILLWKKIKYKSLPFALYTLIIFFTIIYTGDHYLTDILAGVIIALLSFFLALGISKRNNRLSQNSSRPNIKTDNKWRIIIAAAIITTCFIIGRNIKNGIKTYASELSRINFVDYTRHPEKAERSFFISVYLGDYYLSQNKVAKAREFYEKAERQATNFYQKKVITRKKIYLDSKKL